MNDFTHSELSYLLMLVQARKLELQPKLEASPALARHRQSCLDKVQAMEAKLKHQLARIKHAKKDIFNDSIRKD